MAQDSGYHDSERSQITFTRRDTDTTSKFAGFDATGLEMRAECATESERYPQPWSDELRQRLLRTAPRANLCTTDDGEAIQDISGTAVVWSYERVQKNFNAGSIPYVDVVFRNLDSNDRPWGFSTNSIGISRLGSFRIGTIWQHGKCVAETKLAKDRIFTVNFTENAWSYVSLTGRHMHRYLNEDYPLRSVLTDDVLTDLLNFPLPGRKNLLIPCIEFLVRCYGSTPDIARTLSTYAWPDIQSHLYANVELNPEKWLVEPKRHIHNDDALLLASMLYEPYTQKAAKNIFAQLNHAVGLGMKKISLQVCPWFEGVAKIRVRGRWINKGKTFLCHEITGMSQPLLHPYEVRRHNFVKEDPDGETMTLVNRPTAEMPKPEDPFKITDLEEPDQHSANWRTPDPGFQILGPECPVTYSTVEHHWSQKKIVTVAPEKPLVFSTGDKVGNTGVGKIRHTSKRYIGDGGVLNAIWMELHSLRLTRPGFSTLEWYSDGKFHSGQTFVLQALTPFDGDDEPTEKARQWLYFKDNAMNVRGILVIRMVIDGRSFYLFETQRKKKRQGGPYQEETSFGFLIEIANRDEALRAISDICNQIRFCRGRFRAMRTPDFRHWAFVHITRNGIFQAKATLRSAFARMNIDIVEQ